MTGHFFDLDGILTDSRPGSHVWACGALQAPGVREQSDDQWNPLPGSWLPEMFRALWCDDSELHLELGIVAFRRMCNWAGVPQNHPYPRVLEMVRHGMA